MHIHVIPTEIFATVYANYAVRSYVPRSQQTFD